MIFMRGAKRRGVEGSGVVLRGRGGEPIRGSVECGRLVIRANIMKRFSSQYYQSALEQWHLWYCVCQPGTSTRTLSNFISICWRMMMNGFHQMGFKGKFCFLWFWTSILLNVRLLLPRRDQIDIIWQSKKQKKEVFRLSDRLYMSQLFSQVR